MAASTDQGLLQVLTTVAAKVRKHRGRAMGEQNTKASLIEPVLEALGWDVRDPDEVFREFKTKPRDSPVDYALKVDGRPALLVEAKGLGEDLTDRRWIGQVLGYATMSGVKWCVLTDGDEYNVFNAVAQVDADQKFFFRVRLSDAEPGLATEMLALISRGSLQSLRVDDVWETYFIDRRVADALRAIVDQECAGLTRLIRQRVRNCSAREVAGSVRRLRVRIDPQVVLSRSRSSEPSTLNGTAGRSIPRASEITLEELIRRGTLKAPLKLTALYKGKTLRAMLLGNGAIEHNGHQYPSCSAAAEAAISTIGANRRSVNGWTFWVTEDQAGNRVSLDKLRR